MLIAAGATGIFTLTVDPSVAGELGIVPPALPLQLFSMDDALRSLAASLRCVCSQVYHPKLSPSVLPPLPSLERI